MPDFAHMILTLFNVKVSHGGGLPPDEQWLTHRFSLFEKFCYPSVRGQKNQNFTWLVFFDAGTPDRFKERIGVFSRWGNFTPCYVSETMSAESFAGMKNSIIAERAGTSAGHLITTLLDNDDALHCEHVGMVQSQFAGQAREFINFPNGFALDYTNARLYKRRHLSNPFVSLIEEMNDFKTVWCGPHTELSAIGTMRQVEAGPLWLQVVHGRNVINNVQRLKRVPLKELRGGFVLEYPEADAVENLALLRMENLGTKFARLADRVLGRD